VPEPDPAGSDPRLPGAAGVPELDPTDGDPRPLGAAGVPEAALPAPGDATPVVTGPAPEARGPAAVPGAVTDGPLVAASPTWAAARSGVWTST
jgi:hypothetical protein